MGEEADRLRVQNLQFDEAWLQFHHHPPFPTAKI